MRRVTIHATSIPDAQNSISNSMSTYHTAYVSNFVDLGFIFRNFFKLCIYSCVAGYGLSHFGKSIV